MHVGSGSVMMDFRYADLMEQRVKRMVDVAFETEYLVDETVVVAAVQPD